MSLQIAVLGMLWDKSSHPYEIKKLMLRYNLDQVVSITDGALYYSFASLVKKGYVSPIEVVHTDNRPDKTMYAITDKGRQGLVDEIYKSFKKSTDLKSLSHVLPFLKHADSDRLAILIEDTIEKLEKRIAFIETHRLLFPEAISQEEIQLLAQYSEEGLRREKTAFQELLKIVKAH
ncbi:PadR family transcriptional regulator [Paenibacillus spiritus]|uniref:PadR family transcriptional regulator n=1 Tax=Paenibacillus spiritus TaxID=2496557 RepID=A0A5J5G9K8_9BACL|nr:PadR family transcriptional regulator [Paenibacillus spiritus]KAA9004214.1 PadR family transcriptional regulator [Paenibacillus spiritus]